MSIKMSQEEIDGFLDSRPGWIVLSTIGEDGFPHSVPLGYFRDGNTIYCGVRQNTRKLRNIEANPKVCLMVESGQTMGDIKGVMLQGHATVHVAPSKVLELMRLGASARGVATDDLPTEPRPGAAYIEISVVNAISWDYAKQR